MENGKKTKHKGIRIFIGIIFIFIGLSLIFKSNKGVNNIFNTANTEIQSVSTKVNLEKFNKIEIGMSYSEVVEIIGEDGTLMNETTSNQYTSKTYYWYAKNNISNAIVVFENGKVSAKNQIGLK